MGKAFVNREISSKYSIVLSLLVLCVCLTCAQVSSKPKAEDSLRMIHILYRHGDRGPISFYPKDPFKDKASKYWPEGLGQLTKIGKMMEYDLGAWLRRRYGNFIGTAFNPQEVNIVSTDYDRTLMSAQCVLASFYYPSNETRFIEDLPWIPTPVHTSPKGADELLNVDAACPRMSQETAKLDSIPEVIEFYEKHKELFTFLSEKSGSNLTTALEVDYLFDTLKIERIYNLSIPTWAVEKYDDIKAVGDFSFRLNTFTHELKRLRGGPLLGLITDNMRKKSHGELDPDRKMFMFSAHDTTVAALLDTMGVFNKVAPPYAATVLIELHEVNGSFIVKGFYQNDSSMASAPNKLIVPGCVADCPLDEWIHFLSNVTPKNWSQECYRPDPARDHRIIVGLAGLSSFLAAVLIVQIIRILCLNDWWWCLFKNHARKKESEPLLGTTIVVARPEYGTLESGSEGSLEWSSRPRSLF